MYALLAILVLGLVVAAHEFGHFIVAKFFKIGVIEFAIGMGPAIIHKRIGETVYSLRLFPIGGYCAMVGENAPETDDKGTEERKERTKSKRKEPDFKTDWTSDRHYKSKPKWQQLLVLLAGPFTNIAIGFVISILSVVIYGAEVKPSILEFLGPDVPAVEAGLEVGDTIIQVDNRKVTTYYDYHMYITCYKDRTNDGYILTVEKADGSEFVTKVVPDPETHLIGISMTTEKEQKHGFDIIKYAANNTMYWLRTTIDGIHMLTSGGVKLTDMTGIIGTTAVMNDTLETAETSENTTVAETLMTLVIFLSINLGIMNLMPFPALDGGRALITWIEGAFNKQMPAKVEAVINGIGFCCLIGLMIFTAFNDIINIIIGKI